MNNLVGPFGTTQILAFLTELTITKAAEDPAAVPLPWRSAEREQVLRESAHLARRLLTATNAIAIDLNTPVRMLGAAGRRLLW
ncbi:hypothetical protein [Nocardia sp. NPDC003979]